MSVSRFTLWMIGMLLIAGCDSHTQPSAPPPSVTDQLTGPVRVSVVQRTSEPVPEMEGRLHIHIDDITAGQTLVKITTADGASVLANTSVRVGGELTFRFEDQDYVLRLLELNNFLTGDDYGVFEVAVSSTGKALTEEQKIEHLIRAVEVIRNATFIRNGKGHTPAEAAEHMRNKWQWKSSEIKTADDFIRIAASNSSVSDEPYLIRFDDGREVTSSEFLRDRLRELQER